MPLDWTNLKAIFELFSRRKSLLYFFPSPFNIKLLNSFILVWRSDYELSSRTQKPFFILKESSKCHNITYRAKNHVVMFCFGLQSIARFISTNSSYFNTHTFKSRWSEYGLGRYSRPRAQFLPIRTSQPVNNIYLFLISKCFRRLIFIVMFPCSLKIGSCFIVPFDILPMFSCSPNPWETLKGR